MTLVADPRLPAPAPPTGLRGVARRLWGAPLAGHVAALALVLLALVPVLGTGSSFSADEGAVIVQARSLADGDGWIVPHPLPQADPGNVNYPLENSEQGVKGLAPYAKHPLYPVLLAGASRVGGVTAMVAVSLAGTLVAAGLAAALARRIDPPLVRPTLWVTGLASPLLFDGYVVIAHTLAAAVAVAAVLLAVRALEQRRVVAALAVGPCVAAAVLLRTEAVFLALGLVVAVAAVGLLHRRLRAPAVLVAAVTVVSTLVTRAGEAAWLRDIIGEPVARTTGAALSSGGLEGRVRGFVLTWLTPGYGAFELVHLALVAMLAAVVVAAFAVRRHPDNTRVIAGSALVGGAAALVALLAGPTNIVPGLLVAFPLAVAGLVLVDRDTLRLPATQLALGTFMLFSLGVIATQYARGGSGEWGGRYFALGIPLVVPVLLLAVRNGAARLPRPARMVAGGSLAVCIAATSAMAIGGLVASHRRNETVNAAVSRAARTVAPTPDQAVIVATDGATARLGWPLFPTDRWLLASASDLEGLIGRVTATGVDRFVVVTKDPGTRDRLGPAVRIVSEETGGSAARPWQVLVVTAGR